VVSGLRRLVRRWRRKAHISQQEERWRQVGARSVVRQAWRQGYARCPPEELANLSDEDLLWLDNIGPVRIHQFRTVYGYGEGSPPSNQYKPETW